MDVRRRAARAAATICTASVTFIHEGPAVGGARSTGRAMSTAARVGVSKSLAARSAGGTVRTVRRVAAVIEGKPRTLMFSIGEEIGEKKHTWSKSSCPSDKPS